jgi:uncharacterized protein (TIGR02246 family)
MRKLLVITALVLLAGVAFGQNKYDIAADKEAIIKINKTWDVNVLAGNLEANAEHYVVDAIRIENGTMIVGKEAIRKSFRTVSEKSKITNNENTIEDIRISGDLAVVRGIYSGTSVSKEDGETTHENGAWIDVLERQPDGSWKSIYGIGTEIKD